MSETVPKGKVMENFGDWVSPMLVKELRQGLRSNTFIATFLIAQVVLFFALLFSVENDNPTSRAEAVGNFIYGLFALLVLILQPIRGITSLSGEMKDGHMELVSLTQLSAWRTVWSKWSAVMLQSLLIWVSILPFIMVRYFFGGMDLFMEGVMYLVALIFSGVLVAGMIAVSGLKAFILRGILTVGMVIASFLCFTLVMEGDFFGFEIDGYAISDWQLWAGLGLITFWVAYLSYLALTVAVRTIAPIAENHSTMVRMVTLGVLFVVCLVLYFMPWGRKLDWYVQFLFSFTCVVSLAFLCLTERSAELQTYLAIQKKKRMPFHYWLTAPGWEFGFWIFSIGVGLFFVLMNEFAIGGDYYEMCGAFIQITAAALFPRVILPLLRRRVNFQSYMVTLIILGILLVCATALVETTLDDHDWVGWALLPLPVVNVPSFLNGDASDEPFFYASIGMFIFYWLVVASLSVRSITKQLKEMKQG